MAARPRGSAARYWTGVSRRHQEEKGEGRWGNVVEEKEGGTVILKCAANSEQKRRRARGDDESGTSITYQSQYFF